MKVQVAAAQIVQSNDAARNCELIIRIIIGTAADVICFPETALTGESKPVFSAVETLHRRIISTAAAFKKLVIWGEYTERAGKVFNEAWVAGPDGLAAVYRKRHLWRKTEAGVTAGTSDPPVIETPFGKIGVLICWDIAFPEEARSLARRGAEIIFVPAYWYGAYSASNALMALVQARAFENQVFVVLADAYAEETVKASRMCAPTGVRSAAGAEPEVISAALDLKELVVGRQTFDCYPRNGGE